MDRFEQGLPVYRALLLTECFFLCPAAGVLCSSISSFWMHVVLLQHAAAASTIMAVDARQQAGPLIIARMSADNPYFWAPFCDGHSDTSPILFRVIVARGADSKSTPSIKILSFPAPKCVHPYGKQAAAPTSCGCRCQFVLGGACNRKIRRNGAPAALIPPFRL